MSNLKINLKDKVFLYSVSTDGYGDETIDEEVEVKGLFLSGTSQSLANSTNMIGTDAHCYLDLDDPFITKNYFRLEGMYLGYSLFPENEGSPENFYKITRVKIGQRKLLGNEVNNIHCFLQKSEKPLSATKSLETDEVVPGFGG